MLETFTVATLSPRLGETFRIRPDASTVLDAELIEVTELGGPNAGPAAQPGQRAPFSIVFRGPRDVVLPQRIFRMEHPQMGTFELFLVPIGPDQAGMRYEAVFT